MKTIRVGVIGVGNMGRNHCRVFSSLRCAELVGVSDLDQERGRQIARQYEVGYYPEVDQLLTEVDAVSVATTTQAHFDLAMHCMDQGIHVFVEKPLTETVEQAQIVSRSAAACPVIVQVGHIERFNPTYAELLNVLEDMHILAINFRRLSAYQGSNTDVDVISDLMIHDLDLALHMVQRDPVSVSASGLTAFSQAVDHTVAHLHFHGGPLLTLTASRITEQKVRSIEVMATEAFIEANLLNKTISVHRRTLGEYVNINHRGVKYRQESVIECIHVPAFEPLYLELEHFVDCVAEGKPTKVPAEDGLKALGLATAIRESLEAQLIDSASTAKLWQPSPVAAPMAMAAS